MSWERELIESARLEKFCLDTPENRVYAIEHIDEAPMNGIPIIKHLLEEIENLKSRLTELEVKKT